jgi:hypothetical protein
VKAAKKGRIVIIPLNETTLVAAQEAYQSSVEVVGVSDEELTFYGASVDSRDMYPGEPKP